MKILKIVLSVIIILIHFIIGAFFVYNVRFDPFWVKILCFILAFLPTCYFSSFLFFMLKHEKKYLIWSSIILNILLSFLSVFYYFSILFALGILESAIPVQSIKYYNGIIKSNSLEEVFPKKISKSWDNVSFCYYPAFLQGNGIVSLYYKDENLNIEEFDNKYKDKAIYIGTKEEYKGDGMIPQDFNNDTLKADDDLKIYLINSRCSSGAISCNHGEYLLVGVNEKTKEVIYKSSWW